MAIMKKIIANGLQKKEQANNRITNRFVIWNGLKKTLAQWSDYMDIKYSTLRQRFYCYKWSIEKCLTYRS